MLRHKFALLINTHFFWIAFFTSFLILEYVFFKAYILRELVNHYPANFDAASYLNACYSFYEKALETSFWKQLTSNTIYLASSFIFCPQAVLGFMVLGASRLSALTINFIYFVIFQIVFFRTIFNYTKKYSYSFLAIGILLSAETIYFWAGSLTDFRIDFMAFCLYGIFVSLVIDSKIFLSRYISIITGFVAAYLILLRYITFAYIFGAVFTLGMLLFLKLGSNNISIQQEIRARLKNILLFTIPIILIVTPVFVTQWDVLYTYYGVNHLVGGEKNIRAALEGITDLFSNLSYYPNSLFFYQIGSKAYNILAILLSTSLFYFIYFKINKKNHLDYNKITNKLIYSFIFISILIPLFILTCDYSKSPIVASILVPSIIWLSIIIHFDATKKLTSKTCKFIIIIFSFCVFLYGIYNYIRQMQHHNPIEARNNIEMNKMYEDIGHYFVYKKNKHYFLFSVDNLNDYLTNHNIQVYHYEKHRILLTPAVTKLGAIIFQISEADALEQLNQSDVFICNLNNYPSNTTDYPFNKSVDQFRHKLINIADQKFKILGNYSFKNSTYRVYVK